jgi:gliding motility-associated-like protein
MSVLKFIHLIFYHTNMKKFYPKHCVLTLLAIFALFFTSNAQNTEGPSFCAGEEMMQQFLKNAEHQNQHQLIEQQIQRYMLSPAGLRSRSTNAIVTLPVVVHIIHNGGTENISDAQVLKGIQDLNDAFANKGYYDPTTGVNTDIQFCLAQRDPNGLTTNGITRDVSPLTNMTMETDDTNLKNINRWKTTCYINIWLIKEISSNSSGSGVAGYAYLPSAHGSIFDGIVEEARWFGSSPANSGVTIHEMGHYLGLYHTFNGDCENDNCLTEGDHVCDTPPDQSRGAGCNPSANSCTTDTDDPSVNNPFRAVGLGGKGDVADMSDNYMDYSPFSCYSSFTQGQKDRMNFFIQNTRKSLLACKSCETPCPTPVTAAFTPREQTIGVGTSLTFTNTSINATSYKWRVGTTNYSTPNITHSFNTIGFFKVVLESSNADARCQNASDSVVIEVICPVKASISPLISTVQPNTTVNFTAITQNVTNFQWKVNNVLVGSNSNFNYLFTNVGNYNIELIASNGLCSLTQNAIVVVNNQDTCKINKFSKSYKIGQNIIQLSNVEATSDQGAIITGTTDSEIIIARLDSKGQVLWARQFPRGDNSDYFRDIKITTDDGCVVTGNNNGYLVVYKLKSDGSVEWARALNEFNCMGHGIVLTNDGGYAIAGRRQNYTEACVVKLSSTGTTQWSKLLKKSNSEYSYGLTKASDGNLVVVCNSQGTYTPVFKFNVNTGAAIWQKEYESGAANDQINHSLDYTSTTRDGNLLVSGGWDDESAIVKKIDTNGNILWAKKMSTTGESVRAFSVIEQTDGTYLAFLYSSSNQDNILLKLDANFNIVQQKKLGKGTAISLKTYSTIANGDYYIVGFTNNQSSLIKLDAILESCSTYENANINIVNQAVKSQNINTFTFDDTNPLSILTDFGVPTELSIVEHCVKLCDSTTTNCNNPLFSKNYSVAEGKLSLAIIIEDKNNTFIAAGRIINSANTSSMLLKLDATGNILWAKKMLLDGNNTFLHIQVTADGGYIVSGYINAEPSIAKFSSTGNLEWTTKAPANSQALFRTIIQTKDGGYAACGNTDNLTSDFVVKLKADGTTQWAREIGSSTTDWSSDLVEMSDGNLILISNTTSTTGNYLMKLDINNGNFIWQKEYSTGASNSCCDHSFDKMAKTSDGNLVITGNWSSDETILQKIDNNGNILWTKKISQVGKSLRGTDVFQTPDGGYIISAVDYNNQFKRVILKLDNNLKIQWQKIIGVNADDASIKGVIALNSGNYWLAASQINGFSISKTDALAKSCEDFPNSNVIIEDVRSQVSQGSFSNDAGREMLKLTPEVSPLEVLVTNRCKECKEICGNGIDDDEDGLVDNADVIDCPCNKCFDSDSVKIVGVDTLCANSNYTFRLNGYKCTKFKTNWLINGNGVDIIAINDTTLSVRFNQGTTFSLSATIQDSCNIDTIFSKTHVIAAPPNLELGPDKTICQTGIFTFKAPRGFKSYLWQDFTTDSVFTAFGAGKYWVRVVDSCGFTQSDTVNIIQLNVPNLNIIPDTLKICEGDSLVVTAPTGWATYRWSPSVGVNDTFKRVITLTPSVSGRYFCAVSTTAGCVSSDSLWVDVKPLLKVSKATSICSGMVYKIGDSTFTKSGTYAVRLKSTTGGCDTIANVILNVISNIPKQIDSLICTSQQIKIGDSTFTKAGNYTVIIKGRAGGCDTIVAVNLKAPLVVEQTLNRTICQGQVYRVGDSTFTKNGIYKVFINNTLCKDTVLTVNLKVTNIAVQTTAINTCPNAQNGRITSSIQNGTPPYTYTWSNGETSPNISNLTAGSYTITISDVNNCKDTANVIIKATPQYSYNLSAKQPTCFGDANGEIRITSTEKLSVSFDSVVFNRSGFLNNLRAGNYPIFVKDSNNCIYSEFINIPQPPQLTLNLPADTLLRLGDSIRIESITNGVGRLKYRWQPVRDLNCDTCASVIAKPTTGILYTLTLTDSTGCQVRDDIKLQVDRVCNIFIPNAFSPFSTVGDNDVFYPYASDCAKQVAFMEVFDRWGEMVFHKINFPLNDPSNAWDGTFNGKQLESAVYTYRIEIILADGRLERFFGDVTLMR